MKNVEKVIVIVGICVSLIGIIVVIVMPGMHDAHTTQWLQGQFSFEGLIWDQVMYNIGFGLIFLGIGLICLSSASVSENVSSGAKDLKLYGSIIIIVGAVIYMILSLNDYNNGIYYKSPGLGFQILNAPFTVSLIVMASGFFAIGAGSFITKHSVSASKIVDKDWVSSPDKKE